MIKKYLLGIVLLLSCESSFAASVACTSQGTTYSSGDIVSCLNGIIAAWDCGSGGFSCSLASYGGGLMTVHYDFGAGGTADNTYVYSEWSVPDCPVGQHWLGGICVDDAPPPPPPPPAEDPAGQQAYDQAISDGYSQLAADVAKQAALDAISAGRSADIALQVGSLAADIIDSGGTVNQALTSSLAAGTPSYYAGNISVGSDPAAACAEFAAKTGQIGIWDAATSRCNLTGGQIIPLDLIAPIEVNQTTAIPSQISDTPLEIAVVGAGAYETATQSGLAPLPSWYVASLAQLAEQNGYTPVAGEVLTQAAIDAMVQWNSETLAAQMAAGQAAYDAAQAGASLPAQQAAAEAAVNIINGGGTADQAAAAAQTAVVSVNGGATVQQAVTAAGSTNTSTGGATESTLQKVLGAIQGLGSGGVDYGSVSDVPLGTKTIDVAITPVAVSGGGSCPAPSPFVLHGQTYFFDWTTYCNFAIGIKPILLAFAWLSAAGILVGGFKA